METTKNKIFEIPTQKVKSEIKLRNVVLFGLPKIGKSTLCAIDEALMLTFEPNSSYIDGYKIDMYDLIQENRYDEILKGLPQLVEDIKNTERFKYVVIDNLSSILPLCKYIAEILYSRTLIGKNWFSENKNQYKDILNLPRGAGYEFLKQGYQKFISLMNASNKTCIFIGHIKEKYVDDSVNTVSFLEVDIPGNCSRMIAKDSDVIAHLYRLGDNYLIFSTKNNKNILTGSNIMQLSNKEYIASELKGDKVISYLDDILTLKAEPIDTTTLLNK